MKRKDGFVYLIWTGTNYFKIGRTNNPEKRIKAHRTSNNLIEGYTAIFYVEDMYMAETVLKRKFEKYMADSREWYELPIHELKELEKNIIGLKKSYLTEQFNNFLKFE
jgi:predicted GIY-YIG superfamily endonuclease